MTLFDDVASEQAKDQALAQVESNNAAWVEYALSVVYRVALVQETFTTDEVWKVITEKPREGRALGAVMLKARKRGWIVPTDRFIPTEKVSQHRQCIRLWESVIYRRVA